MTNELKLNENTLNELKQHVAQSMRDNSFGDGMEWDMIYDGYSFVGLNNMSDVDIVQEYIQQLSEPDELLDRALLELNMNATLKGLEMPKFDLSDLHEPEPDAIMRALKGLAATLTDATSISEVDAAIMQRRLELNALKQGQQE